MYSTVYIEMMGDLIGQYVNLFTSKKDRKSTLIVKNSINIIDSFFFSFFKTSFDIFVIYLCKLNNKINKYLTLKVLLQSKN